MRRVGRLVASALILGVGLAVVASDDKAASPAAALEALKLEQKKSEDELDRQLEAAKSKDAKEKIWEEHQKRRGDVVKRAVALARNNPKDAAALEALTWVITGGLGWGPETDEAFDVLTADHLQSDKLDQICLMASLMSTSDSADRFLKAVLEKSPHRSMRGAACLSLGRRRKYQSDRARYGKEPTADRLQKESEGYYDRVVADFADVELGDRPIGERARSALFEMRELIVGKVAPDIIGADLDGKKFKLSDFRGKVVVLDFWGNW
jgi:hypothetical protein